MKKTERSSILDVFIKNNWYKAQVTCADMCLTVCLIDNYLDSMMNADNVNSQGINEIRRVRIVKSSEDNFGISIKGGKENNMPIFISKIFKGTPADQTAQLNIGDSILSVNGESLIDATHEDAVRCLKRAGNKADLEVKYLREVMLQFRKASLLLEIGWNFNSNNNFKQNNVLSQHNNNNHHIDDRKSQNSTSECFLSKIAAETISNVSNKLKSDTRIVPLLLCHLFKYSQTSSNNQPNDLNDPCTITILSPDLTKSFVLRCPDELAAYTWTSALSNEIHETTLNALAEANMNLSSVLDSSTIKYMGWLSEKIDTKMENSAYRPTFLVLTNKELLFFDKVPYSINEWKDPVSRYQLEHCRLVKGPIEESSPTNKQNGGDLKDQGKLNSFALRIGTKMGVITVQLSSDSYQSLLIWAKKIIESSCNAAIALQEVPFDCIFEGRKCELIINIETGFIVQDCENNEIALKKDFSELINSSDDNARFVTLQFKNEKVSRDFDMLQHPKPFTFTLHTFLFVKMSKLGFV